MHNFGDSLTSSAHEADLYSSAIVYGKLKANAAWPIEPRYSFVEAVIQLPGGSNCTGELFSTANWSTENKQVMTMTVSLERRERVFQTFVDMRLQSIGRGVYVAREGSFKDLSVFLNCLFTAIRQNQHLVA